MKSRRKKFVTMTPTRRGQKPIRFRQGTLHSALGVAAGQRIPAAKMAAAKAGKYGAAARKKALFALNVLGAGRRTAAKNRA